VSLVSVSLVSANTGFSSKALSETKGKIARQYISDVPPLVSQTKIYKK
jgi:hypothetical protein